MTYIVTYIHTYMTQGVRCQRGACHTPSHNCKLVQCHGAITPWCDGVYDKYHRTVLQHCSLIRRFRFYCEVAGLSFINNQFSVVVLFTGLFWLSLLAFVFVLVGWLVGVFVHGVLQFCVCLHSADCCKQFLSALSPAQVVLVGRWIARHTWLFVAFPACFTITPDYAPRSLAWSRRRSRHRPLPHRLRPSPRRAAHLEIAVFQGDAFKHGTVCRIQLQSQLHLFPGQVVVISTVFPKKLLRYHRASPAESSKLR